MPTKCEIIHDAVKSHLAAFWIILSVSSVGVRGQEGKKENSVHCCKVLKSLARLLVLTQIVCSFGFTGLITRLTRTF